MRKRNTTKKNKQGPAISSWPFLAAIVIVASFLLFANLSNQYLWQDEAETALVGRTVLSHGIPLAHDGKNYFSQAQGRDHNDKYVWKLHPWLQFYTVAASFLILGENTFSARLPFALFGLAGIIACYFFTREWLGSRRVALIASGLLALSVPFLILSRQCRYYSAAALFFILGIWSYIRLVNHKKYSSIAFIISSTLLFHFAHAYCFILVMIGFIHACLFHRDRLKHVFYTFSATALFNFPWLFWFARPPVEYKYDWSILIFFLKTYIGEIGTFLFTPWMAIFILIILAFHFLNKRKLQEEFRALLEPFTLAILLVLAVLGIFSFSVAPFFRYLTPLIPIFCIAAAVIVDLCFRVHQALAIAAIVLLVWVQPLKDFVHELTHDYKGPIKGIVNYLNANGKEGDTVLITYGDLPLKFYTKMRVLGGLTGENPEPARNAEWIILRKYSISPHEVPVRRFIIENMEDSKYEPITIDYPDIPYENREGPAEHRFRTVQDESRVVIFKKIR